MFAVEVYAAVRRFVFVEGHSRREAARVFGLSRETVLKMCRFSLPPGYTRTLPISKPKLGALLPAIDAILEADQSAPAKQRHTAKRIHDRLRAEHGFAGSYTTVKDYVRQRRAAVREVFVPLDPTAGSPEAPRRPASCAPCCGGGRSAGPPPGYSAPRHGTHGGPARRAPPRTSLRLPRLVMNEPEEGSTAVHSGTAAAGTPDRLSGTLSHCRSHRLTGSECPSLVEQALWHVFMPHPHMPMSSR